MKEAPSRNERVLSSWSLLHTCASAMAVVWRIPKQTTQLREGKGRQSCCGCWEAGEGRGIRPHKVGDGVMMAKRSNSHQASSKLPACSLHVINRTHTRTRTRTHIHACACTHISLSSSFLSLSPPPSRSRPAHLERECVCWLGASISRQTAKVPATPPPPLPAHFCAVG